MGGVGSQGINPTTSKFTLSADTPEVQGILSLNNDSPPGLYIGYDSISQTWEAVSFKTSYGFSNLLIESSEPLIDVTPVGFVQPDIAGLGGLSPVLLVYDPETGEYLEQTEVAGLSDPTSSRSVVSGDFDNDGDVDLYLESSTAYYSLPSILYDNQGDGTFAPVTNAGGAQIEFLGPRHEDFNIGINLATGDYDRDGFLDIFSGSSTVERSDNTYSLGTPYHLFNNQGNDNNWLQIDLQGVQSNRDGIGTKVFATAGGVTQVRENSGGMHRIGQNQPWLHFGMGENEQVDLRVEWVSGAVQELPNVSPNQLFEIIENQGTDNSDLLIGTSENDTLEGLSGNDTLQGEDGDDVLIGVDLNSAESFLGQGDIDLFIGDSVIVESVDNSNTFVLGNEDNAFYNDNDPLTRGEKDFAQIQDFEAEEDIIHGSADLYRLEFSNVAASQIADAQLIYEPETEEVGEIIANLIDVNENLSLDDPGFTFV